MKRFFGFFVVMQSGAFETMRFLCVFLWGIVGAGSSGDWRGKLVELLNSRRCRSLREVVGMQERIRRLVVV
jgi:hypothetical protein